MPAKNRIKTYAKDGYYYIYNSGIDKRDIFMDDQDYGFFLNLLKTYLSPIEVLNHEAELSKFKTRRSMEMNLHLEIKLLAFCLMPKRFQLLVKQSSINGITKFMRRLCTSYVSYFNQRHQRGGSLFIGVYKGVLIPDKSQVPKTIQDIHLEPVSVRKLGLISTSSGSPEDYPYSSYHHYLTNSAPTWLDIGQTLNI